MKHRLHICFLSALTALALGGCNSANSSTPNHSAPLTWNVVAGGSSQQEAFQALNYYPTGLTINAGDTVTWSFPSGEPHTVTLLPPGMALPPPNDPSVPKPAGGTTFDGTTYTSSGFVLLGGKYSLTFPKPGTYKVYCLIHGGMIGAITVNAAGSAYPSSQAQYTALGTTAQNADLAAAVASLTTFPFQANGDQLAAGISPAKTPSNSTVLRFLTAPNVTTQTTTIPVGTTLTWTNLSNNEPHTVTLGIVGRPFPQINPPGAPTGNTTYDGTAVSNSGIILPHHSYSLKFTKAGTFVVHCVYHDDTEHMIYTVVVH